MDAQTLLRREDQHEMEMKMEEDADADAEGIKVPHRRTQTLKAKGHQNGERKARQGRERDAGKEREESDGWEAAWMMEEDEEEDRGGGSEAGIEGAGKFAVGGVGGGYKQEMPPLDDVCPICFDRFTIPCRSNCGHWFCAICILQFWMFRSSIQPCKCPLCCCQIVNLRPETFKLIEPAHGSVEILKKVNQYNNLYICGMLGTFHRMQALPLLMRTFRVLIDPDSLRFYYYVMRLLGLFLALLYERGEFEFMASGGLGIQRMFDMGTAVAVVVLFLIGIGYRWLLRGSTQGFPAQGDWV